MATNWDMYDTYQLLNEKQERGGFVKSETAVLKWKSDGRPIRRCISHHCEKLGMISATYVHPSVHSSVAM